VVEEVEDQRARHGEGGVAEGPAVARRLVRGAVVVAGCESASDRDPLMVLAMVLILPVFWAFGSMSYRLSKLTPVEGRLSYWFDWQFRPPAGVNIGRRKRVRLSRRNTRGRLAPIGLGSRHSANGCSPALRSAGATPCHAITSRAMKVT
jgi:hypothetical protein